MFCIFYILFLLVIHGYIHNSGLITIVDFYIYNHIYSVNNFTLIKQNIIHCKKLWVSIAPNAIEMVRQVLLVLDCAHILFLTQLCLAFSQKMSQMTKATQKTHFNLRINCVNYVLWELWKTNHIFPFNCECYCSLRDTLFKQCYFTKQIRKLIYEQ